MRTPSKPAVRKAAKGAAMAGTAALAALAVGTLVKRRISDPAADRDDSPREATE
ncbi:hypothetical protein K3N28_06465 [Glycomyces sp. TRM65418]|uniref:hypothetical protein n=1 Tax=Glycomyces sp. TRM65418 TaxID=2867006 RepID=UPI001CE52BEB|nr:hypothetical protein [Glycomyces sp. TRM65418]MCC3762712.1 hypothetical protein [Glycomyces sp. TRM65418]QZD56747.1 hypothetical protein K3N28_06415 [Glycomyces sp. TRM65418]